MVNITLTNKNLTSADRKIIININTGTCTFSDKRKIQLKELLDDKNFSHPLLTKSSALSSTGLFRYEYDDIEGLFNASRYIYSTLLHIDNPAACQFKISPSKKYKKTNFANEIYFSINAKKTAQETIRIEQLNEMVSHLSGFKFTFSEDFIIHDSVGLADLPTIVDGDALYETEDNIIKLLKHPRPFDHLELRYINPIMGFGVYSRSVVHKDDIIAAYIGKKTTTEPSNLEYTFKNKKDCFNMFLNARQHGNITRFINHAPSLSKTDSGGHLLQANVISFTYFVAGIEAIVYSATKDILPGEQLLVNYGDDFFHNSTLNRFKKNGRMLADKRFSLTHSRRKLNHFRIMATHGVEPAKVYLGKRTLVIAFLMIIAAGVLNYL